MWTRECQRRALLSVAFLASLFTPIALATAEVPCTLTDASRQTQYDLRPLAHSTSGYDVSGHDSGFAFKLNVCGPLVVPGADAIGAQWYHGSQSGTLGMVNTTLHLRGDKLTMAYGDGDACPQLPQLRQSMVISFVCAQDMADYGQPVFVAEWERCAFMFEWRTPAACPSPIRADEGGGVDGNAEDDDASKDGGPEGASRGAVAFVAVFVLGSVYVLGGFLYNRVLNTSSRLRGIEQLPNYRLWRGIFLAFKRVGTAVTDSVLYVVDAASGRRGVIRIDEAEHNIRNELFDMYDDEQEILPIVQR
ncbi:Cation-independent mannose-6-phosphate receptor CI-MPR [Coemansia biformis]|uniref:Cation-independent mannose-6-phosphate receptor CI-MPR n=1 Tax=Coemansia biformis TaxID=1286918 RepID=A0A9W7YEE9_9FUNG|nr:Cation-independent mannose-6-phosphate receptor CI-MPR [Coemansia biformis]